MDRKLSLSWVVSMLAMAVAGCDRSGSPQQDEPPFFWCYPDDATGRGWDAKVVGSNVGQCQKTRNSCAAASKRHHNEDLCYRQEIAHCYRETHADGPETATCTPTEYGCLLLNHIHRISSECRMQRLDDSLAQVLR